MVILPIRSASASRRIDCLNADQVSSHVRRYAALDIRLWISIYVKGNLCTKTGKRKTAAASTRHACNHRRRMIIRLFLGRVRHHKELEGKQRSQLNARRKHQAIDAGNRGTQTSTILALKTINSRGKGSGELRRTEQAGDADHSPCICPPSRVRPPASFQPPFRVGSDGPFLYHRCGNA